jgi:hypothetical protein
MRLHFQIPGVQHAVKAAAAGIKAVGVLTSVPIDSVKL